MRRLPSDLAMVSLEIRLCLLLGCVLDNEEIIDLLRQSKVTSNEISKRISAAKKAESEIQAMRKTYLPIATRGALLYFAVASLPHLSPMYQFSLDWFRRVFLSSVLSPGEEQEEPSLQREKTYVKQAQESANLSNEPTLKHRTNPLEKHLKNSVDTLTRNILKVRHSSAGVLGTYLVSLG